MNAGSFGIGLDKSDTELVLRPRGLGNGVNPGGHGLGVAGGRGAPNVGVIRGAPDHTKGGAVQTMPAPMERNEQRTAQKRDCGNELFRFVVMGSSRMF